MTDHQLGPLPDPEAWRTQVGPWGDISTDYAYTANQMRAYALAEVSRAVQAEREACAKVCEKIVADTLRLYKGLRRSDGAESCADAIRARGKE